MDQKPLSQFDEEFLARTTLARGRTKKTQAQFAREFGGWKQSKWSKYETRSLLPHEHVERFCTLTGITIQWLYAGAIDWAEVDEIRKRGPKKAGAEPKGIAA